MVKCSNCRRVYEVKGARGRTHFPCPNCGAPMSAWQQVSARDLLRTLKLTPHAFMTTLGEEDSTSPSDEDERHELVESTKDVTNRPSIDEQLAGSVDVTIEHEVNPGQLFEEAEQIWRAEVEQRRKSQTVSADDVEPADRGWRVESPPPTRPLPPDLSELSGEEEFGDQPEIELSDGDWEELAQHSAAFRSPYRAELYAFAVLAAVGLLVLAGALVDLAV